MPDMTRALSRQADLIRALVRELESDELLWTGLLDKIDEDNAMHGILSLRLASIRTTLDRAHSYLEGE